MVTIVIYNNYVVYLLDIYIFNCNKCLTCINTFMMDDKTVTINDSMEIAYEPYHEQTTDTHWKILRNTTISQWGGVLIPVYDINIGIQLTIQSWSTYKNKL